MEPPLPDPLLHKCVEEREMERREGFMGSMRELVRGNLSDWRGRGKIVGSHQENPASGLAGRASARDFPYEK